MVRLIPLLKRVFFCPKIQREALGKPSPAYLRRPVYRTPCTPRRGGVLPRPFFRAPCNPSAGADASARPPGLYRISNNVSLRSQCAHWLWQSASPVPLAPLPKEAVSKADRGILFPRPVLSVRPGLTPALQPLSWLYPRRSKKSRTPRVPCTRRTGWPQHECPSSPRWSAGPGGRRCRRSRGASR